VRGDPEQLRVVFRNLLENAVRHAGGAANVEVRVTHAGPQRLEVVVADDGAGIPKAALRRIFQPFQQIAATGASPRRGLGLGLSIVRNIVRAHGGSVHARSDGLGRGSRFVVRLPELPA
jgi:two-component system CheB/CheR fusion protein